MCRMIAKVSSVETGITDEMLQCPTSLQYLSLHGKISSDPNATGEHRDGCGIALVHGHDIIIEKRDREHTWDDSYIDFVKKVQSKIFIAHNRQTSKGLESNIEGSHPFLLTAGGTQYAFAHNGTVYDFVPEAKKRNTSETLLFFEQLISQTESNSPDDIIRRLNFISKNANYSSLTAFLMSPGWLMCWRIFNEADKENIYRRSKYYTLYSKENGDSMVISSEPLDDEVWDLLPNNFGMILTPTEGKINIREFEVE